VEEEKDKYADLVTLNPDRSEEIDDTELDQHASASQQEGSSPNDSDLESILKRLFPYFDDDDIKKIAPVIMLGRVFPDNFSTKIYLLVCNLAEKHSDDPNFDVWETETIIEGLCQIGLEGKGRVEAVIISGNTKEQAEQESTKTGGF